MSVRIIFLGAKSIGFHCLDELLNRSNDLDAKVLAVGTNPRGAKVKELAEAQAIPLIHNPLELHDFEYDLLISVQYHAILKAPEIQTAQRMAVNLHMAPLPEYRGCNQFSFAIVNGDEEFGTTLHVMNAGVDTGDILAERRFPIPKDVFVGELFKLTEDYSLQLFREELEPLISGHLSPKPQTEFTNRKPPQFHYRKEIETLKRIDPNWSADQIDRHIRATTMAGFAPPYLDFGNYRVSLNLIDS
ncbi:MAG: methionyl-tRNA formyltransferase [Phormidium sp. OSCR]|nr:MAG: methionyl-tRNA formyltransferase [Phormidium sp. OSCR]